MLWVKGSGGDLGAMDRLVSPRLSLARLGALEARFEAGDEDRLVGLCPFCSVNPGGADAIHRYAAARPPPLSPYRPCPSRRRDRAGRLQRRRSGGGGIWAGAVGWTPWQRPGFDLAFACASSCAARPDLRGVVMAGHGLICWGETAEDLLRQHDR